MCRFVLYLGPELSLSALLTEPEHSLIRQSLHSRERHEPLNGDGFGVVWFPQVRQPARFRSVTPAWSNQNLMTLAPAVQSRCILAHVRAATQGQTAEANCHPFLGQGWAFMHNGNLDRFPATRQRWLHELSPQAFEGIEGRTDSEHLFASFLDRLEQRSGPIDAATLADVLEETMGEAIERSRSVGGERCDMNLAVSNGELAAVSRYTTAPDYDGESLYLNAGQRYVSSAGECHMLEPDARGPSTVISSEPLSGEPSWRKVPPQHIVTVEQAGGAELRPIRL